MSRAATATASSLKIRLGGDTLILPASASGVAVWTAQLTWTGSIQLIGAGAGSTFVTFDFAGGASGIRPTANNNTSIRISGIGFRVQQTHSNFISPISAAAGYPALTTRIDHCDFYGDPLDGVSYGDRFIQFNGTNGLVDHCRFMDSTARGAGNVSADIDSAISTSNSYHIPSPLGDLACLCVEDCTFTYPSPIANGATDNYSGTRTVFRYNTVTNNNVGVHGYDSQYRGCPTWEVYRNTFIATSGCSGMVLMTARSGTGVFWGNTINNQLPMTGSQGFLVAVQPYLYGAATQKETSLDYGLHSRTNAYYPTPDGSGHWGTLPYPGTSNTTDNGRGNLATGDNPVDGNFFGPGHMDSAYTRTVTDLHTTAGSKTITSATANFDMTADGSLDLYGTGIRWGERFLTGGTVSGTALSFASADLDQGDVGRTVFATAWTRGSSVATITAVADSTHATIAGQISNGTSLTIGILGAWIVSVTNSTTAVLNCQATTTTTAGTLTIGLTDQGYPLMDQPARGSFASANAGNWPNVTTGYSVSDFEVLAPMYVWGNTWTNTQRSSVALALVGSNPYIKADREYYDQNDSFTGTSGCGQGLLASRPSSGLTTGVGYFATDVGSQGTLYVATSATTWAVAYTPGVYPHQMAANDQATQAPTLPGSPRRGGARISGF